MIKKIITSLSLGKKGVNKVLGDLETEIMDIVWSSGACSVRDVYENIRLRRKIAYTTVMTIMSRLAKKGLLKQTRRDAAYIYAPVMSREQFASGFVGQVVEDLMSDFSTPLLSHIIEQAADDPEKLQELSELINRKLAEKS
ncbi:MAG: BlaI/MecI/CopY family transcriptional regulator [bacterium]|nr:BlaI/MecI/CopY family transcriptional regulator [bacterium]